MLFFQNLDEFDLGVTEDEKWDFYNAKTIM